MTLTPEEEAENVLWGDSPKPVHAKFVLLMILTSLTTAPIGQLSTNYRDRAIELAKNPTLEAVHKFFQEMWDDDTGQVSSFIKELVNPTFTENYD